MPVQKQFTAREIARVMRMYKTHAGAAKALGVSTPTLLRRIEEHRRRPALQCRHAVFYSNERFYSSAQAAEILGVDIKTIYRYLRSGEFPNARKKADGSAKAWKIPETDLLSMPDAPTIAAVIELLKGEIPVITSG